MKFRNCRKDQTAKKEKASRQNLVCFKTNYKYRAREQSDKKRMSLQQHSILKKDRNMQK